MRIEYKDKKIISRRYKSDGNLTKWISKGWEEFDLSKILKSFANIQEARKYAQTKKVFHTNDYRTVLGLVSEYRKKTICEPFIATQFLNGNPIWRGLFISFMGRTIPVYGRDIRKK